jgi:hypothetical protein
MGSTPVTVFVPQVTRIPITGPAPFNTLVCCGAVGQVPINGVVGSVTRSEATFGTNFILAGFDQRVPPQFQHSTAAWLCGTGPAEDDTWLYAIDAIAGAGFAPTSGEFLITADVAVMYPHIPSQFQGTLLIYEYFVSICSYVLVFEPPPPHPPGGQKAAQFVARLPELLPAGGPAFGVPVFPPPSVHFVEPRLSGAIFRAPRFTSPVVPDQRYKCRCECDCCRKHKCVQQKCKERGCTCSCGCCQK